MRGELPKRRIPPLGVEKGVGWGQNRVVECYCFLINIIVVCVGARRDALVYARCVFYLEISIGLAFWLSS